MNETPSTELEPPPPFGLHEAEAIVRQLAPALNAHAAWVQRIHTLLVCRTLPAPEDLASEGHLTSDLGRWLASENPEFMRRHPDYLRAIERLSDLHRIARSLCIAVSQDQAIGEEEYRAFADALGRLDASLEALVKELWDLLRYTDPLTGIATRYALMPRLHDERSRIQRTGSTCTLCMVDIDHFKRINDTHGHRAGDAVLEAVSSYLVTNLRRHDQVCRYGGEEFVLMLPNTDAQQAVPIVDRLRRGLSDLAIRLDDGAEIHVTASIGIAPLAADQPIGASIEDADQAMYRAKRAGRNRVRVWRRRLRSART